MSSSVFLSIKKQDNVVFDDFHAMNVELSQQYGVGELLDYDQVPPGSLFLKQTDAGFLWMDREHGKYSEYANVYYCWSEEPMQIIANHMTAGVLVLRLQPYGDETEYYRLTPGKVEFIEIE